MARSGDAVKSS